MSLRLLLPLALLFTVACADDPPELPAPDGGASLFATIDGTPFAVSGLLVTGDLSADPGAPRILSIVGATLPVGGLHEGLALAFVRVDGSAFAAGQAYSGADSLRRAAGEWFRETTFVDLRALSAETGVASFTLTAFDTVAGRASGTFSFDAVDPDDPAIVHEIRDGEFTNVPID
jgi:hypothetical protein